MNNTKLILVVFVCGGLMGGVLCSALHYSPSLVVAQELSDGYHDEFGNSLQKDTRPAIEKAESENLVLRDTYHESHTIETEPAGNPSESLERDAAKKVSSYSSTYYSIQEKDGVVLVTALKRYPKCNSYAETLWMGLAEVKKHWEIDSWKIYPSSPPLFIIAVVRDRGPRRFGPQ